MWALLLALQFGRFVVSSSGQDTAVTQNVILARKPCAPDCEKRGNCNYEEGRCECPWGYTGPACEIDRLAACRQTPDDPGSCGLMYPKNCECFRECYRLYCRYGLDNERCAHEWGSDIRRSACWLYGSSLQDALARPQNSSLYPDQPEKETVWFDQIPEFFDQKTYTAEMLLQDEERRYKAPWHHPWLVWHLANFTAHPLKDCPNRCSNGRGVCTYHNWPWEKDPVCVCRLGFKGADCSEEEPQVACWFSPDCFGNGRCVSGFCHCRDGFWGRACHRTQAYQPAKPGTAPDVRSVTQFKIYMYELPWEIAFPYEVKEDVHTRDLMYTAYELFMQYFLTDNGVRTENPYEANLFYVPTLVYFYSANVRNPQHRTEIVLDYIRQTWPFYNRTGGRDHFMFMPGDRGACHTMRWLQDSVIKIVHFGMQRPNLSWVAVDNKDYACIQVKRDLVVPTRTHPVRELPPTHAADYYKWIRSTGGHDGNRTVLFFFAGGVHAGEYAGGARKDIADLLANMTQPLPDDVKFFTGGVGGEYVTLMRTSQFCVAPYGHGWGIRLMQAMAFGCIPLIIQDYVYQPFEDFLPYEEFSVRLPHKDIPRMIEVLRTFTPEQVAELRLAMARHYQAFIWEREFGGKAYEWTMAGLQRRWYQLQARYFQAPEAGQPGAGGGDWVVGNQGGHRLRRGRQLRGLGAEVLGLADDGGGEGG